MTSPLKSATARLNGAKSRGPKTAAGLEKSSRNALKHGFRSAKCIVPDPKDHPEFQQILDGLVSVYRPATVAEKSQVDQMADAEWRLRRLGAVQSSLFSAEIVRQESKNRAAHPDLHLFLAFRALAANESNALSLILRYQSYFHRLYDRAFQTLRELQQQNYRTNLPMLQTKDLAKGRPRANPNINPFSSRSEPPRAKVPPFDGSAASSHNSSQF